MQRIDTISQRIRCALLLAIITVGTISAETWKFFFYMDASDKLADMAFKNITDMMRGNPRNNVEALLQLHAYGKTALRYRITNAGLFFVDEITLTENSKQDFIAAAQWALAQNKTNNIMVVFSNHGWGAIDPQWNENEHAWQAAEISISHDSASLPTSCSLPEKSIKALRALHINHRGFMFNDLSRTYLTNHDLAAALSYVQNTVLQGRKINVIAFDTCMGSMLEVATCIAPYADYLVGVQSCALRDGFNYQEFIAALNAGNSPRTTVTDFVRAFDTYYAQNDPDGIYTCAALDLSHVNAVNKALNGAITTILQYSELRPLLKKARDKSPRFCLWPIYSDLVAFFKLVEEQLRDNDQLQNSQEIISALHGVYRASEQLVVACCGGHTTVGNAHGFAIYLPHAIIDTSYESSLFAAQSKWIQLLHAIC